MQEGLRTLIGMSGRRFEANQDWSPICWPAGEVDAAA
jgi:hypothetical protein